LAKTWPASVALHFHRDLVLVRCMGRNISAF
jgi:hypothetical protein